ncbi:hypothetical protein ACFLTP_09025 [Chloroflexota bacterium]
MWLFKRRKHPTKRDINQPSLREVCYDLFQEGKRPAEVARAIGASPRTVCRYFQDYRTLHNILSYQVLKRWIRENPEFSDKVIAMLATTLGMSKEEIADRASRPWGLLQGLRGEWRNYRLEEEQSGIESRLVAALLIVNFADKFRQKNTQFVRETLKRLMTD